MLLQSSEGVEVLLYVGTKIIKNTVTIIDTSYY